MYRAIFADGRDGLLESARELFRQWILDKGIELEVSDHGLVHSAGVALESIEGKSKECSALRLVLREEDAHQRWVTTLTALASDPGAEFHDAPSGQHPRLPAVAVGHLRAQDREQWIWIDLEWTCEDVFAPSPEVGAPRLISMFLDSNPGGCSLGPSQLRGVPNFVGDDVAVEALYETLHDPGREIPVVVCTAAGNESDEIAIQRALATSRQLAGIAQVALLDRGLDTLLNHRLGRELGVYAGALRTYLPGMVKFEPTPWRHRYIPWSRIGHSKQAGGRAVARQLRSRAVARRPPALYRDTARELPGFPGHRGDSASSVELSELLSIADDENAKLRDRVADLESDVQLAALEAEEIEGELADTKGRVRWLEARSADRGDEVRGLETPESARPKTVSSCSEAIQVAREYLTSVIIADSVLEGANTLDDWADSSGNWGVKAWRAFQAMEAYAALKREGFAGNFVQSLSTGALDTWGIPVRWVTMQESSTTNNNGAPVEVVGL